MSKKIDILNIGFIIISLTLAFLLPFELFIFSYVILGPLHYLTEINWLKGRHYFVQERNWIWILILLCLLLAMPAIIKLPIVHRLFGSTVTREITTMTASFYNPAILVMFLFAIGLVYFRNWKHILVFLIASIIAVILINRYISFAVILIGIFLPTIIHVYLFTLLFMILGALNTRSVYGMIGASLLLIVPLIIFCIPLNLTGYAVQDSTRSSFLASRFSTISTHLQKLLAGDSSSSLFSGTAIRIQVFLAFSYTYHYLNWFSKTSVIGWSKTLSKTKLLLVILIWGASILLYWYDYRTGYLALFFLSLLHVVLEFPLNITSFKNIVEKVRFRKVKHV